LVAPCTPTGAPPSFLVLLSELHELLDSVDMTDEVVETAFFRQLGALLSKSSVNKHLALGWSHRNSSKKIATFICTEHFRSIDPSMIC